MNFNLILQLRWKGVFIEVGSTEMLTSNITLTSTIEGLARLNLPVDFSKNLLGSTNLSIGFDKHIMVVYRTSLDQHGWLRVLWFQAPDALSYGWNPSPCMAYLTCIRARYGVEHDWLYVLYLCLPKITYYFCSPMVRIQ